MGLWTLILCLIPATVAAITVSSNGNSPEMKMIGGMMVGMQKGFTPMTPKSLETTTKTNNGRRKLSSSPPRLSINERYRRLIPYMTFYYANDLISPANDEHNAKNVEVEKAEIVEAKRITDSRQPKKLIYSSNRNIPLYQGNRLTEYNIASANPSKFLYKDVFSTPQTMKNNNFNPSLSDHRSLLGSNYDYERIAPRPIFKAPSVPFSLPTRKPYYNFYNNGDVGNAEYYVPERAHVPKYKLVPYEQTPPVKVMQQNENLYHPSKSLTPVPVFVSNDQVYTQQRPSRPQYVYETFNPPQARKQPTIISESYFEKRRPHSPIVIEGGFKPIITPVHTTEVPFYKQVVTSTPTPYEETEKPQEIVEISPERPNHHVEIAPERPNLNSFEPNYYQYVVDQTTFKPPQSGQTNTITLGDLLNSLQLNKSIPKPITRENVGSSIKTLLQVLNALNSFSQTEPVEPLLSTPKPFIEKNVVAETPKPLEEVTPVPVTIKETDLQDESYLVPVNPPSQHLDDYSSSISSQRFPQPVNSDEEGGTPGRPGVDYPILTTIPSTAFNCTTQRYKGFFADPETRCQVWHYCDLNGGQASFLCPNGTIFSQAGLTCDWWFNVRCASTTQLYVLNESLYKYILPHSPKFPEDYSGPLVDKYLTLKFKEMEEQFKKNKNRQSASDKMDEDEEEDATENPSEEDDSSGPTEQLTEKSAVSEASVIVESPGTSGNVERLQD